MKAPHIALAGLALIASTQTPAVNAASESETGTNQNQSKQQTIKDIKALLESLETLNVRHDRNPPTCG